MRVGVRKRGVKRARKPTLPDGTGDRRPSSTSPALPPETLDLRAQLG